MRGLRRVPALFAKKGVEVRPLRKSSEKVGGSGLAHLPRTEYHDGPLKAPKGNMLTDETERDLEGDNIRPTRQSWETKQSERREATRQSHRKVQISLWFKKTMIKRGTETDSDLLGSSPKSKGRAFKWMESKTGSLVH